MGYIYIFTNASYPELIKIGKTDRNPILRADQLSRQTGVVSKFDVFWYLKVPDCYLSEKMAHFKLAEFRHEKEFFRISGPEAIETIFPYLDIFFRLEETIEMFYNGKVYNSRQSAYLTLFHHDCAMEILLSRMKITRIKMQSELTQKELQKSEKEATELKKKLKEL
jgi:hypothetical protein